MSSCPFAISLNDLTSSSKSRGVVIGTDHPLITTTQNGSGFQTAGPLVENNVDRGVIIARNIQNPLQICASKSGFSTYGKSCEIELETVFRSAAASQPAILFSQQSVGLPAYVDSYGSSIGAGATPACAFYASNSYNPSFPTSNDGLALNGKNTGGWLSAPMCILRTGDLHMNGRLIHGVKSSVEAGQVALIPSDRKLKRNIEEVDSADSLKRIKKLKPSSFNFWYQEKGEPKSIGLIAQDVQEVMDYAVTETQQVIVQKEKSLQSYEGTFCDCEPKQIQCTHEIQKLEPVLKISTDQILATLISAVQELSKQVDAIEDHLS